MKKKSLLVMLSVAVLSLGLVACNNSDTQKAAEEAKQVAQETKDKAGEMAQDAKDKAGEMAQDAKDKADEMVQDAKEAGKTMELTIITMEELAKNNGKDGAKAYIAVDGIVYDVTDSKAWKDGGHNGFEAGKDLTDEIMNKSPHGVSKLEGLTVVGVLEEK